MRTIDSEARFLWRSSTVTSLCSYGDPLNHMENPNELIQELDFRAVWKRCRDLTRSPGKNTSVTRSRRINNHDLTVAIVTDHNDLNGFTAFLFEALHCNHTTTIKTSVKKQKLCVLKVKRFHFPFSSKGFRVDWTAFACNTTNINPKTFLLS